MKRKYELKERARSRERTRQRIVEAAVDLHTSLGPARTTISAIAQRAGVERHTVYAHFPDEQALIAACSAHWEARHPLPDLASLAAEDDPGARLRLVLSELYAWYEAVEDDLALFLRDASLVPANAEALASLQADIEELGDALVRGRPRRKAVRAALGHALEFETWRSLVRRQGLTRAQTVDATTAFVDAV